MIRGDRLPDGFTVQLDRRVRRSDGGTVLVGGSPPRVMRLAPRLCHLVAADRFTVSDTASAMLAHRLLDAGMAYPVAAPDAPSSGDVSVVIPVRDRLGPLRRLLAALAATTPQLGEVIVVDDGSTDPHPVHAVAERFGARVLRHPMSKGPAAARNTGLRVASTPLVAFLDSDVVPQPNWLEPLLTCFADPTVALASPRIVALPPVRGMIGRYEAVRSSLDLGPDPAPIAPRTRVAYVPSAAMLLRKAAVEHGFDEQLRVAEDVDLVLRLFRAGWRLRYQPTACVAHEHRSQVVAWWLRKAYYGTGAAPLAQRHPGLVPPMILSWWSTAVPVLLLRGRVWSLLAATGITIAAVERLARRLPGRRPHVVAARLVAHGAVGAVRQAAEAMTRHYWPAAAIGAVASRRFRRVVATVAVVDGLVDWWRHRDRHPGARPGPLGYLLARRLDDLAYGAGLWWGALRHRSLAALRPVRPNRD